MKAYLKGFYGYKNFGDELLFFGLVNWINQNYDISKLVVEAGDPLWMESWIKDNKAYLSTILDKIEVVDINQHQIRLISHFFNLIGLGKYRSYFKFFGGGEVLDDSRKFPHDGWNIALLYNRSIRNRKFVLLGGIGSIKKSTIKDLYSFILTRARTIICRDKVSFSIAKQYNSNTLLYNDFSYDVIQQFLANYNTSKYQNQLFPYILINISPRGLNESNISKIQQFCKDYPKSKKIFFPCDINDDTDLFFVVKQAVPELEMYNWTKHTLDETLGLFHNCDGGIGSRLHFLYPLQILGKNIQNIGSEEKIQKLISQ